MSFQFGICSSFYEKVQVAWINIHIQSKYVSLNVLNKFEKVVASTVLVTLKASDRGAVIRL